MFDPTTTPQNRHLRDLPLMSFVRHAWRALSLVLAFVLPPLLVGVLGYGRMALAERPGTLPALAQPLPDRPVHDPTKRTATIVAGNTMTESSDLLGPYETLAASGAFNVYVVAPERVQSPLFPGDLSIVPHYSFAEYDATFGDRPDLLVVPYIPYADSSDGAVLDWIRAQADAGTTILSICAGARAVADAGVLAGQRSTTHHGIMPLLKWKHPDVEWVDDRRYVDSGQFLSSAGVTSGVDATLYALSRMFGREHAEQTAQAIGYPHTRFLDDPTWNVGRLGLLTRLPGFYQWDRTDIGLVLYDGVRELEVSSVIDPYPRSFTASVRTIAPERRAIRSRHGLDLVPRNDYVSAPPLDRVLVAGDAQAPAAVQAVQALVEQRGGVQVEPIHAGGGYLYDATFRDMARQESNSVAQSAADWLEYPTSHLRLDGPGWRLDLLARPLALGLLGLGVAVWLRRRAAAGKQGGVTRTVKSTFARA